mmetsp:Transcript_14051/g.25381  ORF Transcript_14051/g.25381 Transcript_14051/m.25381 type:complete len:426 (-) Transcript_14051:1804-3081(-)
MSEARRNGSELARLGPSQSYVEQRTHRLVVAYVHFFYASIPSLDYGARPLVAPPQDSIAPSWHSFLRILIGARLELKRRRESNLALRKPQKHLILCALAYQLLERKQRAPVLLIYKCLDNVPILNVEAVVKVSHCEDEVVESVSRRFYREFLPDFLQIFVPRIAVLLMRGEMHIEHHQPMAEQPKPRRYRPFVAPNAHHPHPYCILLDSVYVSCNVFCRIYEQQHSDEVDFDDRPEASVACRAQCPLDLLLPGPRHVAIQEHFLRLELDGLLQAYYVHVRSDASLLSGGLAGQPGLEGALAGDLRVAVPRGSHDRDGLGIRWRPHRRRWRADRQVEFSILRTSSIVCDPIDRDPVFLNLQSRHKRLQLLGEYRSLQIFREKVFVLEPWIWVHVYHPELLLVAAGFGVLLCLLYIRTLRSRQCHLR